MAPYDIVNIRISYRKYEFIALGLMFYHFP